MPKTQQAFAGVFPAPGTEYDPREESQYRLSVQRTIEEVIGRLAGSSSGTPTALASGDNNNYSIGPFIDFLRVSANGSGSAITGITDGRTNRRLVLANLANTLTLEHEDTASTAENRIITATGAAISLAANDMAELIYDDTSARWRVMGTAV